MRLVALAIALVCLVGFGVWLGRSTSSASSTREVAPPLASVAATEQPRVARVPAPALRAPRVAPELAADLAAADPKIRRAAIREVDDPQALLAASRDPDLEVAIQATRALARLVADGQLPAADLVPRARDRSSPERVRSVALNALGSVASPEAARTLVELAARGDVLERRTAVALLVNQDVELAVPALIDALADGDELVRSQALDSLKARSRGRDFGGDAAAWRAWWQARAR